MIPIPPSCASAIARAASVTVSIGAEISGMFSSMLRVSRVRVSASAGMKSLRAGISRTSSKVMASWTILGCSMGYCYGEGGGVSRNSLYRKFIVLAVGTYYLASIYCSVRMGRQSWESGGVPPMPCRRFGAGG